MTLEEIFERGKTRSLFFGGVFFVFLVFEGARYLVLPMIEPSLAPSGGIFLAIVAKLLEDLASGIVVTVGLAGFLWWVIPKRVRNSGVVIVEPRDLKGQFIEALASSRSWRFCGGCGRYFRSAVLSEMKSRARQESSAREVAAVILNPENNILCEKHARFRAGTRRGQREGWTSTRVKQELLATVIITKAAAFSEGLLDAKIYVSDHFSGFRIDMSDTCVFETREDPSAPALRCENGSYYYSALADEFRLIREQAREITNGSAECAVVRDVSTLEHALATMFLTGHGLNPSELGEVVDIINNPVNPHA